MAFSGSENDNNKRKRRYSGQGREFPEGRGKTRAADDNLRPGDGRAPYRGYTEEYWEDEEDYEEFARRMDRENAARAAGKKPRADRPDAGGTNGRNRRADRQNTGTAAGRDRRPEGRNNGRPAGNDPRTGNDPRIERAGTGGTAPSQKKQTPRRKRGFLGILLRILLIAFLLFVIAAGVIFYNMRDVLQLQRVNSVNLEQQLQTGISSRVKNDERMLGYKNIALFGVDSREGGLLEGDNRSDTIMVCSINENTGEIRLVSIYRDTMLNVGDGVYTKCNAAYALGGPAQAISMLNRNLDLNIVDFVTVGFEGLAHTIDALGGIELEINEEEREYLNQYVHDMHLELGTDDTPVEETGTVLMTGIQATAYSRIRYTAGDDFRRAERQRTVLQKTLEKAKNASPQTLVDVANNVVGDMATSLSSTELLGLIMKAGSLELAGTGGFPQEEYRSFGSTWEDGEFVLPLYLEDNVRWLHSFLFEEEDYILSEEAAAEDQYLRNNFLPSY